MKNTCTKILIVDDNKFTLGILKDLFENQSIDVYIAHSVKEAKALILQNYKSIDLVVSDVSMPNETGFDLLKWVNSNSSPLNELPVLLTTARLPDKEDRIKGLSLGAVDYVVRPVDMEELVLRVQKALENTKRVKSLQSNLLELESAAMLGRLQAAFNHEIKNIANLISIYSAQVDRFLQRNDVILDKTFKTSMQNLTKSASLLFSVSQSVHNIVANPNQKGSIHCLNEIVEDVCTLMKERVSPYLIVHQKTQHKIHVTIIEVYLIQVLINLILNAYDSLKEAYLNENYVEGMIEVSYQIYDEEVILKIKDNGIGLKEKMIKKQFKPFETTKQMKGGQGLGLWLCQNLLYSMNSKLALKSDGPMKGVLAEISFKLCTALPENDKDLDISQYFVQ